jgi:predicted porin
MEKSLYKLVLSSIGLMLASNLAVAQSSVTLYGTIDVGVNYISNSQSRVVAGQPVGGSVWSLTDGAVRGIGGSRWGITGKEELGGGLSAVFQLENGFTVNTGQLNQGGAEFGQTAFVGVHAPLGTISAGRHYTPQGELMWGFSPYSMTGAFGDFFGDLDGAGRSRRANNSVRFMSETLKGFKLGALYSFGGEPGSVGSRQQYSFALTWSGGPAAFGIGYLSASDPNLSLFAGNANAGPFTSNNLGSTGSATSPQLNPIYAGFASASRFESLDAGASYQFGPVKAAILLNHSAFKGLGDTSVGPNPIGYKGGAVFNGGSATLSSLIRPDVQLGAAYMYTRAGSVGGHDGATYQEWVLSTQYFFSKRTLCYLVGAYQTASGVNSIGQAAVAGNYLLTPSATNKQLVTRAGFRHNF